MKHFLSSLKYSIVLQITYFGKSDKRTSTTIEDINPDLIRIGLSTKDYNPPTEKQRKQIEEFAKLVLEDNKKNKKDI